MFKKSLFAITTCLGLSVFSGNLFAYDGTVTFSGNLLASGCTVDGASKAIDLDFGNIAITSFTGEGSLVGNIPFQVSLTNCPADGENFVPFYVKFDGKEDADNNTLLINNGTASGVGIAIYDWSDNQISFGTGGNSNSYTPDAANSTLNFKARLIASADTVTAGTIDAIANFTVIYE